MRKYVGLFIVLTLVAFVFGVAGCAPRSAKPTAATETKKTATKTKTKAGAGGGECYKSPVTFRFLGQASSVNLVGSFNGWNPNDPNYTMEQADDGSWEITVELEPGEYQCKYYIDGNWPKDMSELEEFLVPKPNGYVDDGFGGKNAVIRICQ